MSARDIISSLLQKGLALTADGENIRVEPKSKLTDEARSIISTNKADLLAYLNLPEPKKEPPLDPNHPHEAWRLTFADGTTNDIFTSPEATQAEIFALWPKATAALPFIGPGEERTSPAHNLTPQEQQNFDKVMQRYGFNAEEIELAKQAYGNDPAAGKRTYAALRAERNPESEAAREAFEERAAILEFDPGVVPGRSRAAR